MSTPPPPPPPPPRPSRGLTDALEDAASATPRHPAPSLLTPYALGLGAHPGALVAGAPSAAATAIPTSPLAAVYINHHVPIVLSLQPPNFSQWRTLFGVMFQKSSVLAHLNGAPRRADPAWLQDDAHILSWLYTREHQAVFLATEFCRIEQGSSSVITYFGRLKDCADRLADLGQSVMDREQVLNMFRDPIPLLPPLLGVPSPQESRQTADTTSETALHAARTPVPPNSGGGGNPRRQGGGNSGGGRNRGKGKAVDTSGGGSHSGGTSSSRFPAPVTPSNVAPWTGMVHAWPLPWRPHAPGAGVLGPRPSVPHPFAGVASHYTNAPPRNGAPHPIPATAPPVQWTAAVLPHPLYGAPFTGGAGGPSPAWDQSALVHALNSMHVQQPQPAPPTADWYLDTGGSAHMASSSGMLHSLFAYTSSAITVGDGSSLAVTHSEHTSIPTTTSPLHLRNVVVSHTFSKTSSPSKP
ncbi:uncharacterized protein [Aegilops tauschii subsp. strangulata]|uniref:uncharacterized protein n=1 Tax=Aegilops tauschii subsp. strangulata TaxID=200361 RepID=UPI00098B649A|nr:uncharacterized protein LOC109779417 [Aegilops tauschii subsp. strangulata]